MPTDNCVTKLIKKNDFNVMLTVFDNSSNGRSEEQLYEEWIATIFRSIGDCVFGNEFCVLRMCNVSESIQPIYVQSTKDVQAIIRECFDELETFRIDIMTPHETTFSWIIALSEDM